MQKKAPKAPSSGRHYTVTHEGSLLKYLFEILPSQSRNSVKAYLEKGQICLNGEITTVHDMPVKEGDSILVLPKGISMSNEVRRETKKEVEMLGIKIVYEDEHIIVVDKESGIPTISTGKDRSTKADLDKKGSKASLKTAKREKTVYSCLNEYVKANARSDRKNLGIVNHDVVKIWVVHRLDKGTSGLLIFAKDEKTKDLIQSKWKDFVYERRYFAIIEGRLDPEEGEIHSWLKEDSISLKMYSSDFDNGGQEATTWYRTLASNGKYSAVEFELETGRKNQIRVQTASKGHPIAGDKKYDARTNPAKRLCLHARTLVFRNPYTNETHSFESEIPQVMERLIRPRKTAPEQE